MHEKPGLQGEKGVSRMTADAKVGLLLGLAFIVIIAFLINGLPDFWDGSRAKTGVAVDINNRVNRVNRTVNRLTILCIYTPYTV